MAYVEKEIKVKAADPQALLDYLEQHGGKLLNSHIEKTIRLDTINGDLEKRGVFLRVRSGSSNTITLKEKIADNKNTKDVRARKETEFKIEDVDAMSYILHRLGFDAPRIMEKYRINIAYKGAMLSIDELFFGTYLEIEGSEQKIDSIAEELGFNHENRIVVTYWDILDEYNEKNRTNKKDILFPEGYRIKLAELR
jgi:adenylate cyclase class 2